MDALETAMGPVVDIAASKIKDELNRFKGQHGDQKLEQKIRAWLLAQYGAESFYDALDAFLTKGNTIARLIAMIRSASPQQTLGFEEFVEKISTTFLENHPDLFAQMPQIRDIFFQIYSQVYSIVTHADPYSDMGKFQSALQVSEADQMYKMQQMDAKINCLLAIASAQPNGVVAQLPPDCTAQATAFQKRIEEIAKDYQFQWQFEEALTKYNELLLDIAAAELHGEPKDKLLCSLRCNIAYCHSNLGDVSVALKTLDDVPKEVAQNDAECLCARASIVVQHHYSKLYSEALQNAEKSLTLKKSFHRAYFLRQQLLALTGAGTQQEILGDLDAYFEETVETDKKDALSADYYVCRGLICTTFYDPVEAFYNFKQATECGYNDIVAQFNMLSALYGQAVQNVPCGQRVLFANIDREKLCDVRNGLKELLEDERLDTKSYWDVKRQAVRLYVSTSGLLTSSHDLKPLKAYLPFAGDDYDTIRMLILGSSEKLTPEVIALLNDEDQAFLRVRESVDANDPRQGKAEIERYLEDPKHTLSPEILYFLLQLCVAAQDSEAYRKYREMGQGKIPEESLLALDACAYELEGDVDQAKELFDHAVDAFADGHVMGNALRFYGRNNYPAEQEALLLKMQELQRSRKIYISDLDAFYRTGMGFLVERKRPSAERFLMGAPASELSPETCAYMSAAFYSAINDAAQLSQLLPYSGHTEFQNGFNQALCYRYMCHYDEGLELCLHLVKRDTGADKQEIVKIYWLISDFYLLKNDLDESYAWAEKSHELMKDRPHDETHPAMLSRALRCGHFEGLRTTMEFQKMYPAAVEYIKQVQVDTSSENATQQLQQALSEYYPDIDAHEDQEKQVAKDYRQRFTPLHLILRYYQYEWGNILSFAKENKLRLGIGTSERRQLEEEWVGDDIIVDAETLVIMAFCGCLPALDLFTHIHIGYGSVATIQNFYIANSNYKAIDDLMDWLRNTPSIIFEADGMIDADNMLVQAFSENFFAGYNIAARLDIPFLYADAQVITVQTEIEFGRMRDIKFVTIPSLCNVFRRSKPEAGEPMIYELLKVGEFVSFSSDTILTQIREADFLVTQIDLQPFLICKSSYDMDSFAGVYIQAVRQLKAECEPAAEQLAELLLKDTMRVWRRGLYVRVSSERFGDPAARRQNLAITHYVGVMTQGIKECWNSVPPSLQKCFQELYDEIQTA